MYKSDFNFICLYEHNLCDISFSTIIKVYLIQGTLLQQFILFAFHLERVEYVYVKYGDWFTGIFYLLSFDI